MPHSAMLKSGPGLYEFLIEAELQQYYSTIKNDLKVCCRIITLYTKSHHQLHCYHLKVNNVHQLKYATDEDFLQVGLSRPEVRRLRKIFHKHCPQNYLYKFKNVSINLENNDSLASFDNYKNITVNQRYTYITAIKLFS